MDTKIRRMDDLVAATGKVRPLAPPQTIEIACAGFGVATSKPTAAEQSTSPNVALAPRSHAQHRSGNFHLRSSAAG
jgi:hypothetical protein